MYTRSGETTDLLALLDGANNVLLPEIEPDLIEARRFDALCRLYKTRVEYRKLLEAWSRYFSFPPPSHFPFCWLSIRTTLTRADWLQASGLMKTYMIHWEAWWGS